MAAYTRFVNTMHRVARFETWTLRTRPIPMGGRGPVIPDRLTNIAGSLWLLKASSEDFGVVQRKPIHEDAMAIPINVLVIRDMREVVMGNQTCRLLAFDLKDILDALAAKVDALNWCITDVDCCGLGAAALCRKVDESAAPGLWVSGAELRALAASVEQVVDGDFFGFPKELRLEALATSDVETTAFPHNKAQLVIRAVDSSWFEVYTKDTHVTQVLLDRFRDVSVEDAHGFFARWVSEAS